MVEYSLDLQNINLSAIRTVRVLRPLKAINRVPSKLFLPLTGAPFYLCFTFVCAVFIYRSAAVSGISFPIDCPALYLQVSGLTF